LSPLKADKRKTLKKLAGIREVQMPASFIFIPFRFLWLTLLAQPAPAQAGVVGFLNVWIIRLVASSSPPPYPLNAKRYQSDIRQVIGFENIQYSKSR